VSTPFDAIFVAVKSYDTEWRPDALTYLKPSDGGGRLPERDQRRAGASVVGKDRCSAA